MDPNDIIEGAATGQPINPTSDPRNTTTGQAGDQTVSQSQLSNSQNFIQNTNQQLNLTQPNFQPQPPQPSTSNQAQSGFSYSNHQPSVAPSDSGTVQAVQFQNNQQPGTLPHASNPVQTSIPPMSARDAVVTTSKPKASRKKIIILLAILILVIMGGGLYYYLAIYKNSGNKSSNNQQLTTLPSPVPTSEPVPTQLPTSITEKTYISQLFAIAFSYSDELTVAEDENGIVVATINQGQSEISLSVSGLSMMIKTGSLGGADILDFTNVKVQEDRNGTSADNNKIVTEPSSIILSGLNGYTYQISDSGKTAKYYLGAGSDSYIEIVDFSPPGHEDKVNGILSSLVFVDGSRILGCDYVNLGDGGFLADYCSGTYCTFATQSECEAADVIATASGRMSTQQNTDGIGDCMWEESAFSSSCSPKY